MTLVRWHPNFNEKTLKRLSVEWMSMSLYAQMNLWAIRGVILLPQMFRLQWKSVGMAKSSQVWNLIW